MTLNSLACQNPGIESRADAAATAAGGGKEALVARAVAFELETPCEPPPGDPLEHLRGVRDKIRALFVSGDGVVFPKKG